VSAQIVPQEDLYVALKTGVVDCALYPALYAHTISLQEVASHASYIYPMASGPYVIGVETERWEATDPAIREAITTAAADLWERTNQYDEDYAKELAARDELAAQGVTWGADFPEEDSAKFLEAVSETWGMLADEAGGNAPAYRERVLTALGR
jgi:TRAP-type C4-dicarboxylate transport system substrate-binding protein